MEILHLSSSYPFTDLYKNLLKELDEQDIKQTMYVAIKDKVLINKRKIENAKNIRYIYSESFNKLDSYIYYTKINKIYKDVKKNINLDEIDLVHSHFLFSDGSVAYKLKKYHDIDYIVAVRNADINFFFKYGFHIRKQGLKTLLAAKSIIFISPKYKDLVIDKYVPKEYKEEVERKVLILPNGIDDFWISNINENKKSKMNFEKINLISVGDLNANKNIMNSIKAADYLQKRGYTINFDIIGRGPLEFKIKKLIDRNTNGLNLKLHGYIQDKQELIKLYRNADIFIMPSYHETFGLVYIEALSQGLPVIFSDGQGVDGYFDNRDIGRAVVPKEYINIANNIEDILKEYNTIYPKTFKKVGRFNWRSIAESYLDLYKEFINN